MFDLLVIKVNELFVTSWSMRYEVCTHPKFTPDRLSLYIREAFTKRLEERDRKLEVPIEASLKERLASYSGGEILAAANVPEGESDKTCEISGKKLTSSQSFIKSLRYLLIPVAIVKVILFFFADFLKPFIFLGPYIMVIAGAAGVAIYFTVIKKYRTTNTLSRIFQSRVGQVFIFCLMSVVVWGLVSVISLFTPERGVFASTIKPVGNLQERLFKIETDVAEIKDTTREIKQDVKDIKKAIENLDKKTTGIIANPKTPQEFYHNARYYELQGKTKDAIKAYHSFLKIQPDYIDVHESYQILLNNTGGIEKTRRIYKDLLSRYPDNPVVQMMKAELLSPQHRLPELKETAEKFPMFAPVYFKILMAYQEQQILNLTVGEIKNAKSAYDRWQELNKEGYFKEYYISKYPLQKAYDNGVKFLADYKARRVKKGGNLGIKIDQIQNTTRVAFIPQETGIKKFLYSVNIMVSMQSGTHKIKAKGIYKSGKETDVQVHEVVIP